MSVPRPKKSDTIRNDYDDLQEDVVDAEPLETFEAQQFTAEESISEDSESETTVLEIISHQEEAPDASEDFGEIEEVAIDSLTAEEIILDEAESKSLELLRFEADVIAASTEESSSSSSSSSSSFDSVEDDDVLEIDEEASEDYSEEHNAEANVDISEEEELVNEVIIESTVEEEDVAPPTEDESKSLEVVGSNDTLQSQDETLLMTGKLSTPANSPSCIFTKDGCGSIQTEELEELSQTIEVDMS